MATLNRVELIGRLGKDPEVRFTQVGDAIANVSLATDESYKNKGGEKIDKVEWHNLVFFGRQAELVGEYVKKGHLLYVAGKLQTRKWQDKDGKDRYTTEVRVSEMQFLERRESGGKPEERGEAKPAAKPAEKPKQETLDDDIPF